MEKTQQDFEAYVKWGRKKISQSDLNPGTRARMEKYFDTLTFEQFKQVTRYHDVRRDCQVIELHLQLLIREG